MTTKKEKIVPVMLEWFDSHYYHIREGGVDYRLPSITTVLGAEAKPHLIPWYAKLGLREAQQQLSEAQDRGSRVHHACYALANGGAWVYQPPWNKKQTYTSKEIRALARQYHDKLVVLTRQEEAVMTWRFQQYLEKEKLRIVASELPTYSLSQGLAGTIDYVAIDQEERMWIIDVKTGAESHEHWMQVVGYFYMYLQQYNVGNLAGVKLVYLKMKNKTDVGLPVVRTKVAGENLVNLGADFSDLQHVKAVWDRQNPHPTPEIFQFPSFGTLVKVRKRKKIKRHKKKGEVL